VADIPDGLVLRRHRDLVGRRQQQWIRRALVALLAVVVLLGLGNAFGQRPSTSKAETADVSVSIYSPARVRGGLYFESRFDVHARTELKDATVVLSPSWLEGMTLNTVEPSPSGEASRDGRIAFDLGHIPAGERFLLFLQFQVNPTTVGRRTLEADFFDGDRHLLTIRRKLTVFP
jgi:hypothetical protein